MKTNPRHAAGPQRPARARPVLAAIAAAIALAGCGYRFTATPSGLPAGVRSVYVPMFANSSSEPGAGAWFTEAMREELVRSGVIGGEASDAVIRGEVTRVSLEPGIVTNVSPEGSRIAAVASYRVVATARVRLVRGGETLRGIVVSDSEDFVPGPSGSNSIPGQSILATEANRRVALRRLASTLMNRAWTTLASGG